jgi:hypothetical protein
MIFKDETKILKCSNDELCSSAFDCVQAYDLIHDVKFAFVKRQKTLVPQAMDKHASPFCSTAN